MEELMIKIDNITKQYRLGQIGGTTLREELQRFNARLRHKEDPTKIIGTKDYNRGETFMALNGVSFEVRKGERVGIIGHNGAGKSTLLKLLSRVTAPTGGEIGLNGRVASMLEVGTGFHGELTGRENIYMNGAILGMTKKEIDAKIEDIIDFSECRQFIDTPVKRYSSGMYVKLAFSVAAHLDSEIMIMDEVLAVGDMAFQKKCLEKMYDVSHKDGRTILYVSHNMNTIRQLCDRVVVLDHGKVIFDGGVEEGIEVYSNARNASEAHLDFTSFVRKVNVSFDAEILSLDYKGGKKWVIETGEKVRFDITVKANKDLTNIGYRTRIATEDDTPLSVLLAPNLITCRAGDIVTIPVEADLSQLVQGTYYMTPVLYGTNEFGGWSLLDHLLKGVVLQVVEKPGFNENMRWDKRHWGTVKLPEIVDLRNSKQD